MILEYDRLTEALADANRSLEGYGAFVRVDYVFEQVEIRRRHEGTLCASAKFGLKEPVQNIVLELTRTWKAQAGPV